MDEPQGEDNSHGYSGDLTQPTEDILAALNNSNSSASALLASMPPPSAYEALFAKLQENPHNPDGWRRLVDLADKSGEISKVQQAYDELLKHYPNTVSTATLSSRRPVSGQSPSLVCSANRVYQPLPGQGRVLW
jgi:cleavage stimulation factor subunit 3